MRVAIAGAVTYWMVASIVVLLIGPDDFCDYLRGLVAFTAVLIGLALVLSGFMWMWHWAGAI